jgi:hypothetical protein
MEPGDPMMMLMSIVIADDHRDEGPGGGGPKLSRRQRAKGPPHESYKFYRPYLTALWP